MENELDTTNNLISKDEYIRKIVIKDVKVTGVIKFEGHVISMTRKRNDTKNTYPSLIGFFVR